MAKSILRRPTVSNVPITHIEFIKLQEVWCSIKTLSEILRETRSYPFLSCHHLLFGLEFRMADVMEDIEKPFAEADAKEPGNLTPIGAISVTEANRPRSLRPKPV